MKDKELRQRLTNLGLLNDNGRCSDYANALFRPYGYTLERPVYKIAELERQISALRIKYFDLMREVGYEEYKEPAKSGIRKIKKSKKK